MFGVACKQGSGRVVPVQTQYMDVLDPSTYLFKHHLT